MNCVFSFLSEFKSSLKLHINCLFIAGRMGIQKWFLWLKLILIFQIKSSNFQILVEEL